MSKHHKHSSKHKRYLFYNLILVKSIVLKKEAEVIVVIVVLVKTNFPM